jgi:8-oxo-dGTP pyrophosphatase MutT (NUDIX family)
VRAVIYETIAEAYRAERDLATLVRELEAEAPIDGSRLQLLGSLYGETGDAEKALGA